MQMMRGRKNYSIPGTQHARKDSLKGLVEVLPHVGSAAVCIVGFIVQRQQPIHYLVANL